MSLSSVIAAVILGFSASPALATSFKCVDNGTVEVCVEWSNNPKPVEGDDFSVTFNGSAGADVELLTEDLEWRLWTTLVSDGSVTDFGAITLDPTSNTGDFTVKIADGSGPGAVDVASMVLDGAANPNWEGFSSMAGLSVVTGNLGGLTLVDDGGTPPQGGVLDGLFLYGNLTGPLSVQKVTLVTSPYNVIGGNVTENADITIGEIDAGSLVILGDLLCNAGGTVCPDITVTGRIHDGLLKVGGDVPVGSTVTIAELIEPDPPTGITEANFSSNSADFAGTLVLPNGLENPDTEVNMPQSFSGVIDLNDRDVVGEINVYLGTSTAEIKNGGAVSGDVYLTLGAGIPNDYAGTATFASVSATGEIGTQAVGLNNGQLSGTITVTGNMSGLIEITGSVLSGGVIEIGGSASGDFTVASDLAGTIDIGTYCKCDIDIDGALSGDIIIGTSLSYPGRIMIDALTSGGISVGTTTGERSLIHLLGGLGSGGTVEINATQGEFNAVGVIHVGVISYETLPDVTFNGCIRIYDDSLGAGNSGNLEDMIKVVGCHATNQPLNICVDGDINGAIIIDQTDCDPTVVHSCGTCP